MASFKEHNKKQHKTFFQKLRTIFEKGAEETSQGSISAAKKSITPPQQIETSSTNVQELIGKFGGSVDAAKHQTKFKKQIERQTQSSTEQFSPTITKQSEAPNATVSNIIEEVYEEIDLKSGTQKVEMASSETNLFFDEQKITQSSHAKLNPNVSDKPRFTLSDLTEEQIEETISADGITEVSSTINLTLPAHLSSPTIIKQSAVPKATVSNIVEKVYEEIELKNGMQNVEPVSSASAAPAPSSFDEILDDLYNFDNSNYTFTTTSADEVKIINPTSLSEEDSQILGAFLTQNNADIYKGDNEKNRYYTVAVPDGGTVKTITFQLTHTLLRRESEKKKNQERGDYRWEVLEKDAPKGEGAYGVVYSTQTLAVEHGLAKLTNNKRVIKIQKPQDEEETRAFAKRIQDEHKATSYMKKKAIFRHLIAEESQNEKPAKAYSVMKGLPGDELFKILKEYDLTAAQCVSLFRSVIKAYDEQVFKKGLVHRDVKAENILVKLPTSESSDLIVNFIDYGLAKKAEENKAEIVGTPTYMSPEVLRAKNATTASDIFSLGVLLGEIAGADMDTWEWFDENSGQKITYEDYSPLRPLYLAIDFQKAPERILYRQFPKFFENIKDKSPEIEGAMQKVAHKMIVPDASKRPSIPEILEQLEIQLPSEKEIWAEVTKREKQHFYDREDTLNTEAGERNTIAEHEPNDSYSATASNGGEWDKLFEEVGITVQDKEGYKEFDAGLNDKIELEPADEQRRAKAEQMRKVSQEIYEEEQKLKRIEEELLRYDLLSRQNPETRSVSGFDSIIDTLEYGDLPDSSQLLQNKKEFQERSQTQLPEAQMLTLDDLDNLFSDEKDDNELVIKIRAELKRDLRQAELAAFPSIKENKEKLQKFVEPQKPEIKKPSLENVQRLKIFLNEQRKQQDNPDAQAGLIAKFQAELASAISKRQVPETEQLLPAASITMQTIKPIDTKQREYKENRNAVLAELKSKRVDSKTMQSAQPGKLELSSELKNDLEKHLEAQLATQKVNAATDLLSSNVENISMSQPAVDLEDEEIQRLEAELEALRKARDEDDKLEYEILLRNFKNIKEAELHFITPPNEVKNEATDSISISQPEETSDDDKIRELEALRKEGEEYAKFEYEIQQQNLKNIKEAELQEIPTSTEQDEARQRELQSYQEFLLKESSHVSYKPSSSRDKNPETNLQLRTEEDDFIDKLQADVKKIREASKELNKLADRFPGVAHLGKTLRAPASTSLDSATVFPSAAAVLSPPTIGFAND
ncbi:MAG: protein kinase, partial [Gammaproteobacteria bacterium]